MDVPLVIVMEFIIFLGFDGKLEANSDMEKELFASAIDQLKERFNLNIQNFYGILLLSFNDIFHNFESQA